MKSYTETKLETPFDWNAFLNKETWSGYQLNKARLLARDWVTCACGVQCSIIRRYPSGMPRDATLAVLGNQFNNAIANMQNSIVTGERSYWVRRAKQILLGIEQRSATLIREIEAENTVV